MNWIKISAFFAYLMTAVMWIKAGASYFLVPGMISCALTTVMSCRFILNLCHAYHNPRGMGMDSVQVRSIWAAPVSCGIHIVDFPEEVSTRMSAAGRTLAPLEVRQTNEAAEPAEEV